MDKLEEKVVAHIRACLISFKGRASLRQLEDDYRTLLGERIPYSKFGYKSLNAFMMNIPSLIITENPNGELYVDAKIDEKSHHIADMVQRQKSVKTSTRGRWNKKVHFAQTNKWNPPNASNKVKNYKPASRPSVTSHKQLVSRSRKTENEYNHVPSRIVIPEHSAFLNTYSTDTHSVNSYNTKYILPEDNYVSNEKQQALIDETSVKHTRLRSSNCSDKFDENNGQSLTLSSKKRIANRMSELSLEGSTHSDQSFDTTCTPTLNITLTGNNVIDLQNLTKYYKLGPVDISVKPMRRKKGPTLYNCKITVDGVDYLSYPKEFLDEKSATEYCAKKALDDLTPKCIRRKSLLLSTDRDVKERIPPLLRVHFQGIWSWQVEADYIDHFKEQLPSNWLEIIDSLDCVAVEKIQEKFVLRYCRPGTALQKGKNCPSIVPFDISVPSNTVQFGEDGRLYGQIKCVVALNEIWCCQWEMNESAAYDEMNKVMSAYYDENHKKHGASTIQVGSYYIANAENMWYRIKALEIKDKGVNCFLIDYGDEYIFDVDKLYQMRREFATCPAQAFLCRLAGLEDLYDSDFPIEKLDSLLEKEVMIETVYNTDDTDAEQSLAVVMYDLSDNSSINENLLKFVTTEAATPRIKESIQEVYVTHITDSGDVFVQIRTKGYASFESLLKTLSHEIESNPESAEKITKSKWQNTKDQLYLYKHANDSRYYRIEVLDMSPDGHHAQINFIDIGNFEIIKVSDEVFHPLERVSDILHKFPAQCVRVRMDLETIPDKFVEITSKLMKLNAPVLLKVLGFTADGIPRGEFYRRTSEEEGLFCINKAIMMEVEIITKNESSSSKAVRTKLKFLKDDTPNRNNVPSGGSLERPILPPGDQYFEVKIPFAVNPWNFFVQPYESRNALNKLMEDLQEYSKQAVFNPLQINGILPGQIYAIKHTDDIWYRISILKVIHAGSISVFFCDFGYYASVNVFQLVPLDPAFLVLPYQALKAKLSDIKPKKNKWSMEDCDYFIQLVKDKPFISIIKDVEKDELYESDVVLKLILIDTSTEEDIFIDSELIKKGIAIKGD